MSAFTSWLDEIQYSARMACIPNTCTIVYYLMRVRNLRLSKGCHAVILDEGYCIRIL